MIALFVIIGILVLLPVAVVLNGWALKIIWNWFMPYFFGMPPLTLLSAIAVALVASYLTHQQYDFVKVERSAVDAIVRPFAIIVAKPLITVLFGWILTLFL